MKWLDKVQTQVNVGEIDYFMQDLLSISIHDKSARI